MFSCEFKHALTVEPTHASEAFETTHAEVHGTASLVGVAVVEYLTDESADVGHSRRGPGRTVRLDEAKGCHVTVEHRDLACCQIEIMHAEFASLTQDVIVDIGVIADTAGFMTPVT